MTFIDRIIVYSVSLALFLIPWQTAYLFESSHAGTLGVLSFTLLDAVFAVLFILLLIHGCHSALKVGISAQRMRAISFVRNPAVALGLTFIVYAALSALWSVQWPLALMAALRFFEALIFCALLLHYRSHHTLFVASIVSAAFIQSVCAIGQFFWQESPAASWLGLAYHVPQQLGDAVVEVGDQRWLRAYGSFPHPNVLAAFLSFGLFSCAYRIRTVASKKIVWLLLGAWCSILIGLFFTFSREVWIGTIIGFAVVSLLSRKTRWQGEGISPLTMAFMLGIFMTASLSIVYWEPLSGRLGISGQGRLEQKSLNERIASYAAGWSLITSSPVIGVGMYQSANTLLQRDREAGISAPSYAYQPPHNLFLLIFAELGVIGLLLFTSLTIALLAAYRRKRKARNVFFVGAVAMIAIVGMFDHFFWTLQSGLLVWWAAVAFLIFTPS